MTDSMETSAQKRQLEETVEQTEEQTDVKKPKIDETTDDQASSPKRPLEDQTSSDESDTKKQKTEETTTSDTQTTQPATEEPKKPEPPKPLPYIPWENATADMLDKTLVYANPYTVPGKAKIVKITFDYGKYKQMYPNAPGYAPKDVERLFLNAPWMKTPFGYSPHKTTNGIQNNLRLQFANFIDPIEGAAYQERVKEWDKYFIAALFKHAKVWPLGIQLEEDEVLTDRMVAKRYRAICRKADKAGFPEYISIKFKTQDKNDKLGIVEDKTRAFVDIWNYDRSYVCGELTLENATDNKAPEANHVIPKNSYVRPTYSLQKMYFTNDNGPVFQVSDLMRADERELRGMGSGDSQTKTCPY